MPVDPVQNADYYFDDPNAPGGRRSYHLEGGTLELSRDGRPIRDMVKPEMAAKEKLFHRRVFELLEFFVQHPQQRLARKTDFRVRFGGADFGHQLGSLRELFDDRDEPHRVFQNASVGELRFALPVRDTPSKYLSTYRTELRQHWRPRAMGSGALFQGGHWYFTGRTSVLRHINGWLSQGSSDGFARIVTGNPGSGKSAVLGYLIACTDPQQIREPGLEAFLRLAPPKTIPKLRKLDFALNLRDRTVDSTLDALADCFRCEPDEVIWKLANRQEETLLVLDTLDEAAEPVQIAEQILRPLIGYERLWLLIGCRRPELLRLGGSTVVFDLDAPAFQSDSDVASYAENILLARHESRRSPYRDNLAAAKSAGNAIASAASGNFLVAFIVARSLLERSDVLDPDRERLPRTTEEAFSEYLRRLGERGGLGYARLRRALIPIAYAQGEGLPREVWSRLTSEDVHTLLDVAAAFIPEYEEDGHAVYRFFHHALSEALRDPIRQRSEQRTISEALIATVRGKDWLLADWYTRKYLALHASEAGQLDNLLLDTKFLSVANPPGLLSVLDLAVSTEAQRRANWYRLSAESIDSSATTADRLAQLELVARQQGAEDLVPSTVPVGLQRPWRTRWAVWSPITAHRVVHLDHAVVSIALAGDRIITAACAVTRWDRISGRQIGDTIFVPPDGVWKIAVHDGVIVGGTRAGGLLWRWDLLTGEVLGEPIHAHDEYHNIGALAICGDIIVSGCTDGTIGVWDRVTGQALTKPLSGHTQEIFAVALKDETIVSVGRDAMRFWNVKTGEQRRDPVHEEFTDVAIIGDTIVTSDGYRGSEQPIRRWNLHTGQEIGQAFGPPLHLKMSAAEDIIVSGGHDGVVTVWSVSTGRQIGTGLYGHEAQIDDLAIFKEWIVSLSRDRTMRIWNWKTTKLIGNPLWKRETYRMGGDSKPDGGVRALSVSGQLLVSAVDEEIELRDADTGALLRPPLLGHTHDVDALAIGEDIIVSGGKDSAVRIWDRGTGSPVGEAPCGDDDAVNALALDHDLIVAAGDDGLRFWNRDSGRSLSLPIDRAATALALSPEIVVSGGWDQALHLWDRITGKQVGEPLRGHKSGIYSIDLEGDTIFSRSWDQTVRQWNSKTGECLNGPFPGDDIGVTSLAICGDRIAAGYNNRLLEVLDLRLQPVHQPLQGHEDSIQAVAMKGNIIVSGSRDQTVRVWDLRSGRGIGKPLHHGASVTAVSIVGDLIISAGADSTIRVWDLKSSQLVAKPLSGHDARVTSLIVSDEILVSGSVDCTVRRWNMKTLQTIGGPLRGHEAAVYSVVIEGGTILSGSYDSTLRFWNLLTGVSIHEPMSTPSSTRTLAVDGDLIIAGGSDLYSASLGGEMTRMRQYSGKAHEGDITAVAIGGGFIVSGSDDNTISSWDRESYQELRGYGESTKSPTLMDGFHAGRLDWMLSLQDSKQPNRVVEITGDAIPRRDSGFARTARLYDLTTREIISEVHLGFIVNKGMFRNSRLYLACRQGLLCFEFFPGQD